MKLSEIMQQIFNELKIQSWVEHCFESDDDIFLKNYYFQISVKSIKFDLEDSLSQKIIGFLEAHHYELVIESGVLSLYYSSDRLDALPEPFDFISALEKSVMNDPEITGDQSDYAIFSQKHTHMKRRFGFFKPALSVMNMYQTIYQWSDLQPYQGKIIAYQQGEPLLSKDSVSFAYVSIGACFSELPHYSLFIFERKSSDSNEVTPSISAKKNLLTRVDSVYLDKNTLSIRDVTNAELESLFNDIREHKIDMLFSSDDAQSFILKIIRKQMTLMDDRSLAMSLGH